MKNYGVRGKMRNSNILKRILTMRVVESWKWGCGSSILRGVPGWTRQAPKYLDPGFDCLTCSGPYQLKLGFWESKMEQSSATVDKAALAKAVLCTAASWHFVFPIT